MSVFVWVPGQIPPDRFNSAVSVAVSAGTLAVLVPHRTDAVFSYPEGSWIRAQYPGPDGETIEIRPRPVVPQVRRRARIRSV